MPADHLSLASTVAVAQSTLAMQMQQSTTLTINNLQLARPASTRRAYAAPQAEFRSWCTAQAFDDDSRYTVTGEKLNHFLLTKVVGRERRRGCGGKKSRTTAQPTPESSASAASVDAPATTNDMHIEDRITVTPAATTIVSSGADATANSNPTSSTASIQPKRIGFDTLEMYVAAIVNMWQEQKTKGVNNYPNPREGAVGMLLKTERYKEQQRRRDQFEDRATHTHLDGYQNVNTLINIIDHYFGRGEVQWATMFSLCHFLLLRGQSARELDLADLQMVEAPSSAEGEGSRVLVMVAILLNGKTNQFGRVEIAGAMRNKEVRVCPIAHMAIHLFTRFHVALEKFPDLSKNQTWYQIKAIPSSKSADGKGAYDYSSHLNACKRAMTAAGIFSKAKTHAARGSAARMAELSGADEAQIRRMGRWNNSAMSGCYLTSLPLQGIQATAGFPPERGAYHLARGSVRPPDSLVLQIFPQVEEWAVRFEFGTDGCVPSAAAGGFLTLLRELRVVILQDSVFLRDIWPTLAAWKHPVFSTVEYATFASQLKEASKSERMTLENRLEHAYPDMLNLLRAMQESVTNQSQSTIAAVDRNTRATDELVRSVCSEISPVRLVLNDLRLSLSRRLGPSLDLQDTPVPCLGPTETPAPVAPSSNLHLPLPPTSDTLADEVLFRAVGVVPKAPAAPKMVRHLPTVIDAWKEWTAGLDGRAAIAKLEVETVGKWRENCDTERRFFAERRRLMAYIVRVAESAGVSFATAVVKVEEERVKLGAKTSLDKFQKSLIKAGKLTFSEPELKRAVNITNELTQE